MPDSLGGQSFPDDAARSVGADPQIGREEALAVLRALAVMARASRRHEADVQSAIRGAGMTMEADQQDLALRQLLDWMCIERVVPLLDGGILLSVTAAGMSRAGQADAPISLAASSDP